MKTTLTRAGYTKNTDGNWTKTDGKKIHHNKKHALLANDGSIIGENTAVDAPDNTRCGGAV